MGLISSDQKLSDIFKKRQNGVIPKDVGSQPRIKSLNPTFYIGIYDPSQSEYSLDGYLLHATRDADAAVLMVDQQCAHLAAKVSSAYFVAIIDTTASVNYGNLVNFTVARVLKNFTCLLSFMNDAGHEQAIILPLRNFKANELQEIRALCVDESLANDFTRTLPELVHGLMKLRRPRRATSSKKIYFVDDEEKLFEYGKERHSRLPTGVPHFPLCEITGTFRFGKRIPTDRHFNVSRECGDRTEIYGTFPDCHDEMLNVKVTTHINMFSNDSH